jgi:esterase/lipase superfamily enzyme
MAANLAFRHPQHFQKLAAFSGRYDLTLSVEAFQDLLGGYYDESVYFHTPSHFLPNLNCDWRLAHLRRMDIVMAVGNEDPFLHNNRQLSDILHAKGVYNQLHVWDGRAHRGQYWRRMASLYV